MFTENAEGPLLQKMQIDAMLDIGLSSLAAAILQRAKAKDLDHLAS